MIHMLRHYWLESVVNADKTIVAATAISSSPSSDMFLIRETWMVVYITFLYKFLAYEFLV